ncbi:hypothetical protein ACFYUK_47000 [Nonomuraea wenchangensis]
MAGQAHHPFLDLGRVVGAEYIVACHDCKWTQVVDEDLHEDATDRLLDWHIDHPDQGFDHLSARDFGTAGLAIPPYVRWTDTYGRLAILDERTRGRSHFNHECLAVVQAVAVGAPLDDAVAVNAKRLGISRRTAQGDIVLVALSLYRKGLLWPANAVTDAGSLTGA